MSKVLNFTWSIDAGLVWDDTLCDPRTWQFSGRPSHQINSCHSPTTLSKDYHRFLHALFTTKISTKSTHCTFPCQRCWIWHGQRWWPESYNDCWELGNSHFQGGSSCQSNCCHGLRRLWYQKKNCFNTPLSTRKIVALSRKTLMPVQLVSWPRKTVMGL